MKDTSSSPARPSCLTVIQASPLVFQGKDGQRHPLESTGNEEERIAIHQAMQAAKDMGYSGIDVFFQDGTTDGLAASLSTDCCQAIHISCHGRKEYLALEHKGAMQAFLTDELQRLVGAATGSGQLQLMVLSACDSVSAGLKLVQAGIPHVVCCEGSVRDDAAIIFARNFYRAQACGKSLQVAFNLAREAVRVSLEVVHAKVEANKFRLLPETPENTDHHNVRIFGTFAKTSIAPTLLKKSLSFSFQTFIGRKLEMQQLLEALKPEALSSRIIQVAGPSGIGKLSLAMATCQHISNFASNQLMIDHIFMIPSTEKKSASGHDGSRWCEQINKLWEEPRARSSENNVERNDAVVRNACSNIVEDMRDVRALIVMDAKRIKSCVSMQKLVAFLDDLCGGTRFVRVIVVCPPGQEYEISSKVECRAMNITLGPLDMKSSVMLFGNCCSLITQGYFSCLSTCHQLVTLLVPLEYENAAIHIKGIPPRCMRILSLIGCGNPGAIRHSASQMTKVQFIHLIQEGIPYLEEKVSRVKVDDTDNEDQLTRLALPMTEEPEEIGIVGVEFSGFNKDYCENWNDYVLNSKFHIEGLLHSLKKYGEVCEGEPNVTVQRIGANGRERAVVRLHCAVDIRTDLRLSEYKRVKEICRKMARFLKRAGATEEELEDLMIGTVWRGSLMLLLEAPSSVFDRLYSVITEHEQVPLGVYDATIVGIAPAFLIAGPCFRAHASIAPDISTEHEPDALACKTGDLTLLVPASLATLNQIVSGGISLSLKERSVEDWQSLPSVLSIEADSSQIALTDVAQMKARSMDGKRVTGSGATPTYPVSQHKRLSNLNPTWLPTEHTIVRKQVHGGQSTKRTQDSVELDLEQSDANTLSEQTFERGELITKRNRRLQGIFGMLFIVLLGTLAVVLGVVLGGANRDDLQPVFGSSSTMSPSPSLVPTAMPTAAPSSAPSTSAPSQQPSIHSTTTVMPSAAATAARTLDDEPQEIGSEGSTLIRNMSPTSAPTGSPKHPATGAPTHVLPSGLLNNGAGRSLTFDISRMESSHGSSKSTATRASDEKQEKGPGGEKLNHRPALTATPSITSPKNPDTTVPAHIQSSGLSHPLKHSRRLTSSNAHSASFSSKPVTMGMWFLVGLVTSLLI